MKIDQVAIYSADPSKLVESLSAMGFDEWQVDSVHAKGHVHGVPVENKADLYFNYQMGDFEFEVLHYTEGENWVERYPDGLSHFGSHVDDIEKAKEMMFELGYSIAQEVETISHTNPNIAGKRRYKYVIFDTRETLGFDLKFIERIVL